jgi:hypothetical protein
MNDELESVQNEAVTTYFMVIFQQYCLEGRKKATKDRNQDNYVIALLEEGYQALSVPQST